MVSVNLALFLLDPGLSQPDFSYSCGSLTDSETQILGMAPSRGSLRAHGPSLRGWGGSWAVPGSPGLHPLKPLTVPSTFSLQPPPKGIPPSARRKQITGEMAVVHTEALLMSQQCDVVLRACVRGVCMCTPVFSCCAIHGSVYFLYDHSLSLCVQHSAGLAFQELPVVLKPGRPLLSHAEHNGSSQGQFA